MTGERGAIRARSAIAWAGGAGIVQDVAQFAAMLVLVRLLSPEQYGAMALAQAVMGVATLCSAGGFVAHALQVRDPHTIDWQSHFTAATIWNTTIALGLLAVAEFFATPIWGADVGLSLALLAFAPLIGGPAVVRNSMLCANHNWARFQLLSLLGASLALSVGLFLGFAGFGVAALAAQPMMFVLPSTIDLFWSGFRPTWRYDRRYYRDVIRFGLNRLTAGSLGAARGFFEQTLMSATFSLAVNGIYGRSVGLANLIVGRIGQISVGALYPILTRAERGSNQFRRNSARVLQGIAWIAIPAATFLAIEAKPIVALLYGEGWADVVELLPAGAILAVAGSLHLTVTRLLLANESRLASLGVDVGSGVVSIAFAFLLLPHGPLIYLWALAAVGGLGFLCGALYLIREEALDLAGLAIAGLPPILAAALAAVCTLSVAPMLAVLWPPLTLFASAACFSLMYGCLLLIAFRSATLELVELFPGGKGLMRRIGLGTQPG